eukprot:EG_transcript_17954
MAHRVFPIFSLPRPPRTAATNGLASGHKPSPSLAPRPASTAILSSPEPGTAAAAAPFALVDNEADVREREREREPKRLRPSPIVRPLERPEESAAKRLCTRIGSFGGGAFPTSPHSDPLPRRTVVHTNGSALGIVRCKADASQPLGEEGFWTSGHPKQFKPRSLIFGSSGSQPIANHSALPSPVVYGGGDFGPCMNLAEQNPAKISIFLAEAYKVSAQFFDYFYHFPWPWRNDVNLEVMLNFRPENSDFLCWLPLI